MYAMEPAIKRSFTTDIEGRVGVGQNDVVEGLNSGLLEEIRS